MAARSHLTLAASCLVAWTLAALRWPAIEAEAKVPNSTGVVVVDCTESVRASGYIATGYGKRDRAVFQLRVAQGGSRRSTRLIFVDKTTGVTLRSDDLRSYESMDRDTRRFIFAGPAGTNDPITVVVRDLDHRGKADVFELQSGGFAASGRLEGGQVRISRRGRDCAGQTAGSMP